MGNIRDEVFLGKKDQYDLLLKQMADFAIVEKWSYGKYKATDPYKILKNYFEHTYSRISEEGKFVESNDGKYKCMNTGLLTIYNQEIYAIFAKNEKSKGLPWYFSRVCRDTDTFFNTNFSTSPECADYFDNVYDLIYDKNLEIKVNINHIIDDNYPRFADVGYFDKQLINALLASAITTLKKRLLRNFKIAVPFNYHNTYTGEHKIQLLVPVYFPGAPVRLALVLDKQTTNDGISYYEAITVLPVEWAYMNSRLIVKPDDEWAKLIDEADNYATEENTEITDSSNNI